jgi:hypothetical protein
MVRTLGGCIAVAICSAVHREYLKDRLSTFLSPAQLAAVQKSNGFIAQLPEDTRHRIGSIFGESYNRQFQVMLAFAGLNVIITIVLAVVRKRSGIFGIMPRQQNPTELTGTKESKTSEVGERKTKDIVATAALHSPSDSPLDDTSKTATRKMDER